MKHIKAFILVLAATPLAFAAPAITPNISATQLLLAWNAPTHLQRTSITKAGFLSLLTQTPKPIPIVQDPGDGLGGGGCATRCSHDCNLLGSGTDENDKAYCLYRGFGEDDNGCTVGFTHRHY